MMEFLRIIQYQIVMYMQFMLTMQIDFILVIIRLSSSGNKDIRFNKVTVGNTGKGNNFSTIDVGASAYFARYNDLTLKFMQDETTGFSKFRCQDYF